MSVEGSGDEQKPAAKHSHEEIIPEPTSEAAMPRNENWIKWRKKGREISSKKSADAQQRFAKKKKSIQQLSVAGDPTQLPEVQGTTASASRDYDYLDKKDWDVLDEPDDFTTLDLRKNESYKLSELSKANNNLPFQETDFSATERDFKKAEEKFSQLLQRPTPQGFKTQKQKLKDAETKAKWVKFYKNVNEYVQIEASIHQYSSVVELGWRPLNFTQPLRLTKDKKLRGQYILKVKRHDTGDIVSVPAANDWVENNFSHKSLATAQKAFMGYYEKTAIKDNPNLKRIIHEQGFIDVADEQMVVKLDNDIINKLKYHPPTKVKIGNIYKIKSYRTTKSGKKVPEYATDDAGRKIKVDREELIKEERWTGYCTVKQKVVELTRDFVETNFSTGLIEQIKHLSKKAGTRWIAIPPGDDKTHSNPPEQLQTGPEIKFLQKKGEKTCLVYSFASALYHAGVKQLASEFYRSSKKIVEHHNTFHKFSVEAKSKNKYLGYKKLKTSEWNILESADNDLVIVSLKGSDGKEDHCVTLFGKWIFDSNFKNALPLCKASLDLCCSSDEKKDTFVSVAQARKFSDWKYLIPSKRK